MIIEKQYIDKNTGKEITVALNGFGYRCGYVTVNTPNVIQRPNRLYHKQSSVDTSFRVHGGITFTGEHSVLGKTVIGFDCAHFCDAPDLIAYSKICNNPILLNELRDSASMGRKVWTVDDVSKECESLAEQIKLIEDLYNHTRKLYKRNKWKHKDWRKTKYV